MNYNVPSDKIYIAQSRVIPTERGVFARSTIQKGECIEICPVIDIPELDTAILRESILITYMYYFGKKKERSVLALGFGSIYNHSYQPNARYKELHLHQTIEFWATKNINKDEEILVNYIQDTNDTTTPLWFEIHT